MADKGLDHISVIEFFPSAVLFGSLVPRTRNIIPVAFWHVGRSIVASCGQMLISPPRAARNPPLCTTQMPAGSTRDGARCSAAVQLHGRVFTDRGSGVSHVVSWRHAISARGADGGFVRLDAGRGAPSWGGGRSVDSLTRVAPAAPGSTGWTGWSTRVARLEGLVRKDALECGAA